jgi:hypothetical protein
VRGRGRPCSRAPGARPPRRGDVPVSRAGLPAAVVVSADRGPALAGDAQDDRRDRQPDQRVDERCAERHHDRRRDDRERDVGVRGGAVGVGDERRAAEPAAGARSRPCEAARLPRQPMAPAAASADRCAGALYGSRSGVHGESGSASTACNGSVSQNVLPCPGVLRTPTVPPIRVTSRLVIARPIPVPP